MSHTGKIIPNLDQNSTKILNLTVLQRIDPFVEEILLTAAHVTFYEFNGDLSQWSRKDVEGSLFVVKRNTQPRFQFIVMNRRSTDNLVENLLDGFEYEVQVPYLLYRNATQDVNGIWFYNTRECEEVANLFGRILNAYSKVPSKTKKSSTKSEFEELDTAPNMAVMDGSLEPASATATNIAVVPDDPFVNFFSTAMTMGIASNVIIPGHFYQSSAVKPPVGSPSANRPTIAAPVQTPTPCLSASIPLMSLLDPQEPINNSNRDANLVKPSAFFVPPRTTYPLMMPPVSSPLPIARPPNAHANIQRPYGAPLLQPLPPPTPSPSLTPSSALGPGFVITREKVRDALQTLIRDNQFIDIVYRAIINAHHP